MDKITVEGWKMMMAWDHQEQTKHSNYPAGVTTFYPPIERTTMDNVVHLNREEKAMWKRYNKHLEDSKIRIDKLKKKNRREYNKLLKQR